MDDSTYRETHEEGHSAYEEGKDQSENPYDKEENTPAHDGWNDGWLDAMWEN